MLASNRELVKHIVDEIDFVIDQTISKHKDEVTNNPVLSRALVRSLEIIGEASSKLDNEFRQKYPHIEWRKIISTRNKLIHNYFGIDYDIVWDIVVNKLPDLKIFLDEILAKP